MSTFLIDIPVPSMGATVNELTVVTLKTHAGAQVHKGQRLADLESDKSIFEFESPCDGTIRTVAVKPGDVVPTGALFLQIETNDATLRHLQSKGPVAAPAAPPPPKNSFLWCCAASPRSTTEKRSNPNFVLDNSV